MNKKTDVMIECKFCQAFYTVSVNQDAYKNWKDGEGFIQDLMPNLSSSERELLISKTCDECWKAIFLGVSSDMEQSNA